ncbi:MAG TPA: hypothetical protein V6D17_16525 [Candidatus Obscuribacterales bacterium]
MSTTLESISCALPPPFDDLTAGKTIPIASAGIRSGIPYLQLMHARFNAEFAVNFLFSHNGETFALLTPEYGRFDPDEAHRPETLVALERGSHARLLDERQWQDLKLRLGEEIDEADKLAGREWNALRAQRFDAAFSKKVKHQSA